MRSTGGLLLMRTKFW